MQPEEVEEKEDWADRLHAVEREIERRCRAMIDRADSEAKRMLSEAEQAAARRARVDSELLMALSEQIVELSESYREALAVARRTVEQLSAMLRAQNGDSQEGDSRAAEPPPVDPEPESDDHRSESDSPST